MGNRDNDRIDTVELTTDLVAAKTVEALLKQRGVKATVIDHHDIGIDAVNPHRLSYFASDKAVVEAVIQEVYG